MIGFGLGDILKPDLIMPLISTLPVEQRLASYLPEVLVILTFCVLTLLFCLDTSWTVVSLQGQWSAEEILELLQSPPFRQQVDSFSHVRIWIIFSSVQMLSQRLSKCSWFLVSWLQVLRTGQIDLAQFGIDSTKCKYSCGETFGLTPCWS